MVYPLGHVELNNQPANYTIIGKLTRTDRKVKPVGAPSTYEYKDESGQLWAKIFGYWWKFPEEIEY